MEVNAYLTSAEVAHQVRNAFSGAEALSQQRGRAYTSISRRDARRTVTVTVSASIEPIGGFVLAMLVIYFLLTISFRSYSQPLIVMIAIPFGSVGAILDHLLMGYNLSLMSMMGIVALSGVVVNDSLVLIDYTNRRQREGACPAEAICIAGLRCFRPIILTTLTTFGGLTPMIFETSRQVWFMIPMALSLGYGILFATAITLILVPCLYLLIKNLGLYSKVAQGSPFSQATYPAMSPQILIDAAVIGSIRLSIILFGTVPHMIFWYVFCLMFGWIFYLTLG